MSATPGTKKKNLGKEKKIGNKGQESDVTDHLFKGKMVKNQEAAAFDGIAAGLSIWQSIWQIEFVFYLWPDPK